MTTAPTADRRPEDVSPGGGPRQRVLDHLWWTVQVLSGSVSRYGPAWGVRTPALPQVWTLNQLHVATSLSVEEVLALSEEHQDGLTFRHVEISDEAASAGFEEYARPEGWTADREVLMVLGPGEVFSDAEGIALLDEEQAMGLMRRWLAEEFPSMGGPVRAQLEQYTLGEGRLWAEQVLGGLDDAGRPAAMTKLRLSVGTAWLEDVYTVPEERRRGHARRLVTRAASLAAEGVREQAGGLVFIVADDDDWPKRLYAEIGFRPVGRVWTFHKELVHG